MDILDENEFSAIHYAVIKNNYELLTNLHSRGVNILSKKFYYKSESLINLAVIHGWFETVELLLKLDSSLDSNEILEYEPMKTAITSSKDSSGNTCMHLAAINGDIRIFISLLMKGGNIQQKNKMGKSPMDLVRDHNHKHIIEYLKDI